MLKTMLFRNAMCIVALFSIMALFFCFGVVATAAESGETETFTYSLSYEVPNSYTSKYIGSSFFDYDRFSLSYRLVILHSSAGDNDVITSNKPDKVVVTSKYYNIYFLSNDGSLSSIGSKAVSVSYTLRRVLRSGNNEETIMDTGKLQSFNASSISTDIPIYEADEAGKAAALEYLKTGKQTKEGYNIYLNDLKVSDVSKDVVNVSWTGYTLDPALRNNANIVDYKVERRVYPYVELSEGETDLGWNPWEIYSNSVPGKLLTADFIFSPSSKCPYKNGFSQLWLDLWPVCIDADGTEYVGKKYHYYFDADGKLTHTDNPIGSLTPIYDPDCNFVDFNVFADSSYDKYGQPLDKGKTSVQECDSCYYFISATDFTHSYDVVSKDIKVFAYYPSGLSSGYEIPFDNYGSWIRSDLVKSGFSFDISLGQLRKRYGFSAIPVKRDNMDFTLRFIPYYYSGDNLYYGNASIVEINGVSADEYQEVGDPSNSNNPKKKINPDVDISSGDAGGGSGGNTPTEADKNTILSFIKGFFELMAALFQESVKFLKQLPGFLKSMWSLIDLVGQFPAMVSKVFSFLPSVYSTMLVGGLALAILLRIFGR